MYEQYYGFSERPFQLSPDPRFFFASSHHQRALSYLQYGLDQGEGFIVITGPIGTGKTTLARNLLASVGGSNIVAIQIVTSKLNPHELLELVASEFKINIQGDSKAELLQAIESFLLDLHRQGKRALLVVDEAQNLPEETVEELRMLSNFQLDNKPLIQSFLLGQEELREIIQGANMEQFRQRIIASCHLKPLSCDEVRKYILHRLHQVGCDNAGLFSEEALVLIHEKSAGIPRKINIFVDRILLFGFLEELTLIDVEAVKTVADEMAGELTGSLNGQHGQVKSKTQGSPVSEPHKNIKEVLADVEEILDDSIRHKVKMARYIDKLLKEKSRQLAERNIELNIHSKDA
jgi:putative secretion ATPase (PEP-CTERM system associated)